MMSIIYIELREEMHLYYKVLKTKHMQQKEVRKHECIRERMDKWEE